MQDMTALSYLNEPGVLWNLNCRYMLDAVYTYTGSILIAVNPFASLPHMYGQHMMEQYKGRDMGELSPHVYAIADSAYRQMRKEGKSQSILVDLPHCHILASLPTVDWQDLTLLSESISLGRMTERQNRPKGESLMARSWKAPDF